MKKIIGIILIIIGAIGFLGMFASKSGGANIDNGIAYLLGGLSPIAFLIIGFILVNKKGENK
ncbi:hypothetical protein [Tenacibaculum maritimum]|uniref:hypothetical protein n=1 Tax=Tenacibaculum maritimum TaxID=107401 RepID=UPI0012E535E5|nr:hypothetical protein [Tenacibaculum maritimum]CAA0236745.1 conserved hypothetical protein [Tenacibaculum maritimum]